METEYLGVALWRVLRVHRATQIATAMTRPLPAGDDLTMVFTLKTWGAESRAFTVKDTPTTQMPTTTTVATGEWSIFGSASPVPAGGLCLASVIYAVACCSDADPIC